MMDSTQSFKRRIIHDEMAFSILDFNGGKYPRSEPFNQPNLYIYG